MEAKAPAQAITAEASKSYRVVGKHVYGSAIGCNPEKLSDEMYLRELVARAAEAGGMTLLDVVSWKLNPGVTVIGVIVESHISVHTWPEYAFATIDVYSCGEHTDPERAFDVIVEGLEAKYMVRNFADRSLV